MVLFTKAPRDLYNHKMKQVSFKEPKTAWSLKTVQLMLDSQDFQTLQHKLILLMNGDMSQVQVATFKVVPIFISLHYQMYCKLTLQ